MTRTWVIRRAKYLRAPVLKIFPKIGSAPYAASAKPFLNGWSSRRVDNLLRRVDNLLKRYGKKELFENLFIKIFLYIGLTKGEEI
jgi:hypothetical protein